MFATNALLARLVPTEDNFEEHQHKLTIDDIRVTSALKKTKKYTNFDMYEEAIPTEIIKLCIDTLTLDAVTSEEKLLGCFTRKKLKKSSIWNL